MSFVLFFAVLFVLILVHEWGHFIVAKKTGMRVDEFGIGFPPRVFGLKWRGTEYTLNLFPIGGFVRIFGESGEEGSHEGSFTSKSKMAQAAVLVAGVTMNVIFAWVVFVAVSMIGVQTPVADDAVTSEAQLVVVEVLPDSPADEAGIPLGASVVALRSGDDQLSTLTSEAFTTFAGAHRDNQLSLTYRAGGNDTMVSLEAKTGVLSDDPERAALGIALSRMETVRQPFMTALVSGTKTTVQALGGITVGIVTLFGDALQLKADFSQVAGPIGIAGLTADAAAFGLTSLLVFAAFISLNLAVINMLPFPALDGGRLLFVALEAMTGRSINATVSGWLNTAGFVFLILIMLAVTYSDIVRMW